MHFSSLTTTRLLLLTSLTLTACEQPLSPQLTSINPETIAQNRATIERFYMGIEYQQFAVIKTVFAPDAYQLIPYAPPGFPRRIDGVEAIYNTFNDLTVYFSRMRFPRTILATEDPAFFVVKFKGDMDLRSRGKYENDYVGTFRLKNGKIVEYTEYFDPFVMANAFGLKIN